MFKKLWKMVTSTTEFNLVEGMYADEYKDSTTRMTILQSYRSRFPYPVKTPWTHPWQFDPLNPPEGWRYDPYYELWLKEPKK